MSSAGAPLARKPAWLRARVPVGRGYERVLRLARGLRLHTVCEEAHCPNLAHCWSRGTATFLILGDVCTRACRFCAVDSGRAPVPPDPDEPRRVAEAVERMGLTHVVITSVTRDDEADGGAALFAACVREIRARTPACTVELLIPDFGGDWQALATVTDARPDVLNHNVETVPRLYAEIRPQARFERSLDLLGRAQRAGLLTKSGFMLGLGEGREELMQAIQAVRAAPTAILTLGQYLRPGAAHAPVARYYTPDEFADLGAYALSLGFAHVESAPLVRSSFHAEEQFSRA